MASRRENRAKRGPTPASLLLALLLIGSLALGAAAEPAAGQAKARIVSASATLSGEGLLLLRGRVAHPRAHWRIVVERRTAIAGGAQPRWVRVPGASKITRRGRFRLQAHLSAGDVVIRPLLVSRGRTLDRHQPIRLSAPNAVFASAPKAGDPGAPPVSQLLPGEKLTAGEQLVSPDNLYRLVMQGDGNLVLYKGSSALWSSGTPGYQGAHAIMQPDGNLVVYAGGSARWHSGTNGFPGAQLVLQNDSNLVIYHAGHPLWDRHSGYLGNSLRPGWTLSPGAFLLSSDGQYRLVMQGDGNLVLYKGPTALWSSTTNGNPGAHAVMQPDGNLVVYAGGSAKWHTQTNAFPGSLLFLQNDSNLVLYHQGTAIWDRDRGLLGPGGITEGQWPENSGPVYAHQRHGYWYPNPPACTGGGACVFDAWRFYQGQCTSWVAYRLNQLNAVSFHHTYLGRTWGDAANWGSTAQVLGIPVNGTPALGSVAWYASNHVAYVEQVFSPTEVLVSDMNYDEKNGFRVRRITSSSAGWPTGFIHIKDR